MKEYRTCPDCGDNLDPGEHCKCREKENVLREVERKNTYRQYKPEYRPGSRTA